MKNRVSKVFCMFFLVNKFLYPKIIKLFCLIWTLPLNFFSSWFYATAGRFCIIFDQWKTCIAKWWGKYGQKFPLKSSLNTWFLLNHCQPYIHTMVVVMRLTLTYLCLPMLANQDGHFSKPSINALKRLKIKR